MDWKYIFSQEPNRLSEENKDELLNTIAWHDLDTETLDIQKCLLLLKISQEIMKYKSEQVEALIAELDEVATKQGEDDMKRQESEYDNKSVKSKKSTTVEFDELEEKYREVKIKLKLQAKSNDKQNKELNKLNERIKLLEDERLHLQNELQSLQQDDTHSDLSETIKEQHRELIDSVHSKNRQISKLLNEIEIIENENVVLKEHLENTRDKLADATNDIDKLSKELVADKLKLEEYIENIHSLEQQKEALNSEILELDEERKNSKKQLTEFALEIDARVDEWKRILDEKNEEIKKLKAISQGKLSSKSSVTATPADFEHNGQIALLNKVLSERENKIFELQTQLQAATEDMRDTTNVINKLTNERDLNSSQINTLKQSIKELRKQLKQNNIRCQEQQEQVIFLESLSAKKDKDMKDIFAKLKDGGHSELAEVLGKMQNMKTQKRYKDKQMTELIKDNNELQETLQQIERENMEMRSRLGMTTEDTVCITGVLIKERKQKRLLLELQSKIEKLEEENLLLRLEIKTLNQTTDRDTAVAQSSSAEPGKTVQSDIKQTSGENTIESEVNVVTEESHKAVVEENEALRKGLHEILASLQSRTDKGLREIKSETLEQLLRALDVKHISGWYHPAMRLQAEMHALQGSNVELREQLKNARIELQNRKETNQNVSKLNVEIPKDLIEPTINSSSNFDVISNLNMHLMNVIKENESITRTNTNLLNNLENCNSAVKTLEEQMGLLYQQYSEEKTAWNKDKETFTKITSEVTEKVEVLEAKLKDISKYIDKSTDEESKVKQISEMSGTIVLLNRKSLYLENENTKLLTELKTVKQDLLDAEIAVKLKINNLNIERNSLMRQVESLKNEVFNVVSLKDHKKLLNDFENLTLKHRSLLSNLTEVCLQNNNETGIIKESIELLKSEKEELFSKLKDVILKLNTFEVSTLEVDKGVEVLTKKLSQTEISEITERQRANHMTNLYELVKEQLKKSEERYKELEKYNKDLMYRNLSLQESLKNFQDKVINEVDLNDYALIQNKCAKLLEEKAKLAEDVEQLQDKLEVFEKVTDTKKLWSSSQEYEFLNLKHQILDLQASTDDKALIARLSSEVVHARLMESEIQKKLDSLLSEFKKLDEEYENFRNCSEEEYNRLNNHINMLTDKNSILHRIVKQQREQYFGCIPMTNESKFVDNLVKVYKDKHEAFLSLQKADEYSRESEIIKEQLREQLKITEELKIFDKNDGKLGKWYNEKCLLQLQELKHRRKSEFVEIQLQQALDRIEEQDQLMNRLEEELLQTFQKTEFYLPPDVESVKLYENDSDLRKTDDVKKTEAIECNVKLFKSEETQTVFDVMAKADVTAENENLKKLHVELINTQRELKLKEETIGVLKSKQTELEMNISMFKNQLGDKQSQITFYEKHIVELQNKKESAMQEDKTSQEVDITRSEEYLALKATITSLQSTIAEKEASIIKFQSLLKQDRDEHSLAAARMQEELKRLQNALVSHQQSYKELKENQQEVTPNKVAVEQYIKQVHNLEDHTLELHTTIASLESQLQSCREECVRWRGLSNDRLQSMDNLRQELETAHRNEVTLYKEECEKWRQEVLSLKSLLIKHTDNTNDKVSNVQKIIKERDNRIHELMMQIRQTRFEARKAQENLETTRIQELESEIDQTVKELETLRKRHEHLLNREKSAREEIRTLKGQLIKRPVTARSDRSDSAKEQLQKKVCTLEKEVDELRENLKEQLIINEQHRMKVNEDFEKWNKQKYWQQTAEKLKIKLKEKCEDLEKVQQTCSGYRILIERLEKEKHILESKNKNLRCGSANVGAMKLEMLEIENAKLQAELEAMNVKLEMRQHHSGGLGAAMLQDKLEGQERKIAILELAAKGTGELRAELERLQTLNANLQKSNLRLEAENLDYKLDLEKSSKELPHLREQIQHLENYIEVLKNESSTNHEVTNSGDHAGNDSRKTSELERTVFVLKRIVEKLQAENKRLQSGKRTITEKVPDETLRRDFYRLKEQYGDSVQKTARLEDELNAANNKLKQLQTKQIDTSELDSVRSQLSQKTELLDKVKVLLHRAAVKEKSLLEEIEKLKTMVPSRTTSISSN